MKGIEGRDLSVTRHEAEDRLTFCDSYTRLPTILALWREGLSETDALAMLGEAWTICDNVWEYADDLDELLPSEPTRVMMDDAEWDALHALPARVTVYRGADRGVNESGYCWSLDRDVATRFPFFMRYRAKDPVLVTATVARHRIAMLKLSREEREIVTLPIWPLVRSVKPLQRKGE